MSEQLIQTPGVFGENGNFLLERELGQGGMGGVYMGRDKMLDRPVAVKVMLKEYGSDTEFVERFKKEAQSAARLVHPNIVQIYSYGICDGMPYMAMELAPGGSLYTIMQNAPGKTDIPRVLKICQQVAQALQCASDQGFVHGDVKPENILLDANGNAKLVDFGLAAMQKDTDEIWGTPYYISPEKVRKEAIDFRADMYSLGGTLYHALTGVAPFEGEDAIAVVKKRFEGAPKKPSEIRPEITPAVDELVMKLLETDRENRYPTFEALLEAFKGVLTSGLTTTAKPLPRATTATTSAGGGTKIKFGTRKTVKFGAKKHVTTLKTAATKTEDAADDDVNAENPESAEASAEGDNGISPETANDEGKKKGKKKKGGDDEEDDEEGGNLGLKIALVIIGVILLIGGVIGGLIWYRIADAKARVQEEQNQIAAGVEKARDAIKDTVAKAKQFADEFDAFAQEAVKYVDKPTEELLKILPPEQAALIKPSESKELLDAIAATNETPAVVEAPAAPAPAATNAVPAAASTNAPAATPAPAASNAAPAKAAAPTAPAKDAKAAPAKDAKAPAKDAKAAAAPAKDAKASPAAPAAPAPNPAAAAPVVVAMNELWNRAYGCLASAVRIRHAMRLVVRKAAEAETYKESTRANMEKLAELSRTLVEMMETAKGSKDVENVKKSITYIKQRGDKTVEQAAKRLRIEKLEAERKAKAEAAAAAEKARAEKAEAERKAKIEAETAEVKSEYETIAAQGSFRQLDWKNAIRRLEAKKSAFETPEGQLAAGAYIRRVNCMQKAHEVFVKNAKDYVFTGRNKAHNLKGCKVLSADAGELKIARANGKGQIRMLWSKFFHDCPGYFNELINRFIVGGRTNCRPKLSLREWTESMTGAAMIMQNVCADVPGATEKGEQLIKDAVKAFPEYATAAKEMFPEMTFEEAAAE